MKFRKNEYKYKYKKIERYLQKALIKNVYEKSKELLQSANKNINVQIKRFAQTC